MAGKSPEQQQFDNESDRTKEPKYLEVKEESTLPELFNIWAFTHRKPDGPALSLGNSILTPREMAMAVVQNTEQGQRIVESITLGAQQTNKSPDDAMQELIERQLRKYTPSASDMLLKAGIPNPNKNFMFATVMHIYLQDENTAGRLLELPGVIGRKFVGDRYSNIVGFALEVTPDAIANPYPKHLEGIPVNIAVRSNK